MLNEISAQNLVTSTPGFTATPASGKAGKLHGMNIIGVITPQSIFEDAMEEMTFVIPKRQTKEDLKSRRERDASTSFKERLKAFKQATEAEDAASVDIFVDRIDQVEDPEEILQQVLEEREEPAEAWAFLDSVYEKLQEKGAAKETLEKVNSALQLLDQRYGAAIRAGVCGTLTASESYVSLGEPKVLGQTYRKAVLEFTDVLSLYSYVNEKHGGNFEQAIDFLYAALKADVGCDLPSCEATRLTSLNTSIGKLRSFQSAHALCSKVMAHDNQDAATTSKKGLNLLGQLLDIGSQPFPNASQINTVAGNFGIYQLEDRIYFLQNVLQSVRTFSPLVFDKPEGRNNTLGAVQAAVDQAVEEEDKLLAQS